MNRSAMGNSSNHTRCIALLHRPGHYPVDPGEYLVSEPLGTAHTSRL